MAEPESLTLVTVPRVALNSQEVEYLGQLQRQHGVHVIASYEVSGGLIEGDHGRADGLLLILDSEARPELYRIIRDGIEGSRLYIGRMFGVFSEI